MPPAVKKEKDAPSLKGKEAEQTVLDYIKKINRPYGSSDISANLKNAVSKPATQKILVSLAEAGQISQKTYGKATVFVANQSTMEAVPPEKLQEMTSELAALKQELTEANGRVKHGLEAELAKLLAEPTDDQLDSKILAVEYETDHLRNELQPMQERAPALSPSEISDIDTYWAKWRAEWVARRKIFREIFDMITDSLPPDQRAALEEDLGIEYDSVRLKFLRTLWQSYELSFPLLSQNIKRSRKVHYAGLLGSAEITSLVCNGFFGYCILSIRSDSVSCSLHILDILIFDGHGYLLRFLLFQFV